MKKVLAFVKSHLLIVLPMVLAILGIPAILYFAFGWNAKIKEDVTSDVSKAISSLNGLQVTYEIPPVTAGEEAWSVRSAPNADRNRLVKAQLERITAQSGEVRRVAVERSGEGRSLLIDGDDRTTKLFPAPLDESARVSLLTRFAGLWPEAHEEMLRSLRAGMPPEEQTVRARLEASYARERDALVRNRTEQELTPEEETQIRQTLAQDRLALYTEAARKITVYAEPSAFRTVQPWPESAGVPSIEQAWQWQFLYWVHEDVLAGIRSANSNARNPWLPVAEAPIKRILSIDVVGFGEPVLDTSGQPPQGGRGGRGGGGGGDLPLPTDPNQPISPDYSIASTGRAAWPDVPNAFFDIRYVDLELIVDAEYLMQIIEAFNKTRFTTVIDMEMEALPPGADLAQGFAYGGGQLARLEMRLETVWIREWMKQWMPDPVKQRLGIPIETDDEDNAGEDEA